MIIDSHQHLMLSVEQQLERMKEQGIDRVVLFATTPHPEKASNLEALIEEMNKLYRILGGQSKERNIERLKEINQEVIGVIKRYPEKFDGFGTVPLGLTLEETKSWIKNDIVGQGLKGIGEFTPGIDEQVAQLEIVFEALKDYPGLPIWVHTFNPVSEKGIEILMALTKKYPMVPVIFGHMGGYYWMKLLAFAKEVENAYIDFSATFSTLAVKMAITEIPERCLFASDAPYGDAYLSRMMVEKLSPTQEISKMILGENIRKILSNVYLK